VQNRRCWKSIKNLGSFAISCSVSDCGLLLDDEKCTGVWRGWSGTVGRSRSKRGVRGGEGPKIRPRLPQNDPLGKTDNRGKKEKEERVQKSDSNQSASCAGGLRSWTPGEDMEERYGRVVPR